MSNSQLISIVVSVVVVGLVLALRWRRMSQSRPLKLEQLYIVPAIFALIVAVSIAERPPAGLEWAWVVGALLLGGIIGWYRGRFVTVTVDPATHALNQKSSPAAFIFLAVLVMVRLGLRSVAVAESSAWHLSATVILDAFLAMAFGLIAVQRLEIYLRAKRLLDAARRNGPPSAGSSPPAGA